jgi:hypothetical protein
MAAGGPSDLPSERDSHQIPAGFIGLAQFPERLAELQSDHRTLLFHLFRPQQRTRRLFALVTGAMELTKRAGPTLGDKLVLSTRMIWGLVKRTAIRSLLGAAFGVTIVILAILGLVAGPANAGLRSVVTVALALIAGFVLAISGLLVGAATGVLKDIKDLPEAGFGISSGNSDDDLALTPWLYGRFQELAGRPYDDPLTFGDLRREGVTLQMMTTNLSRAQPMVMPWDDFSYFFNSKQYTELFGTTIVNHLLGHPPPLPSSPEERWRQEVFRESAAAQNLHPLPFVHDLPIIVATRMSLSFPLLITAVPLYAVDWTRAESAHYQDRVRQYRRSNPDARPREAMQSVGQPIFDINWFSDGGLTSNLPVQFFDSPLSNRPTFAIDLVEFPRGDHIPKVDEKANTYLRPWWLPPERRAAQWQGSGLSLLAAFGGSLVYTARNWVDEAALVMPGYRERVITIYQDTSTEGGMNLNMPQGAVDRLSERGRYAARKLIDSFGPDGRGWPQLRWIQFRTATAALTDWLERFDQAYDADNSFYNALLQDPGLQPSHPVEAERLMAFRQRLAALLQVCDGLTEEPGDAFTHGRPQAAPVLRLMPRIDVYS